jgi:hypothetical protein
LDRVPTGGADSASEEYLKVLDLGYTGDDPYAYSHTVRVSATDHETGS